MFYDDFVIFEPRKGSQLYALCPFHKEDTASFTVNEDSLEWYCHGCGKGGAEIEFLMLYYDIERDTAKFLLEKGIDKLPQEAELRCYEEKLFSSQADVASLLEFGMTFETLKKYRIGLDDLRIIFPIFSQTGYCVNLRKYLPSYRRTKAEAGKKVISVRGLGIGRYYPYEAFDEALNGEVIYIVEGEKDCLVARSQGLNAVTGTSGGNIPAKEIYLFNNKIVYLMLDTDVTGQRLTRNYKQLLRYTAKQLFVVELPKKDFTDFWMAEHSIDLEPYIVDETSNLGVESNPISLTKSEFTENLNSWMLLKNMSIIGTDPKVYTVPKSLKVICNNLKCEKPCGIGSNLSTPTVIPVDPRQLLQFIDSADAAQDNYLKKLFSCKSIIAEANEYVNAQKFMFQEVASFIDGLDEATFEPRYGVFLYDDYRLTPTLKYDLDSCRVTDPRNQQNFYIVKTAIQNSSTPEAVDFDYFKKIADSCKNVGELIEAHYQHWLPLIGIEGRADLFGVMMLTYCSVTEMDWRGGLIKGWLDSMVIGDTRTGKSQMAQRVVKALALGGYINGENSRKTGIIGGVQKFGESWVVTWGAIPMNDKGLLVVDEASGLTIEDFKELSSARSSGAVTINKIVKSEARARTRLLWMSNPRSGRNLEDFYWKGFGAFLEFIPVAEDQARFDLVVSAAREDVTELSDTYKFAEVATAKYIELIKFAWSVEANDIIIIPEVAKAVSTAAKYLETEYGGGTLIVGVAAHEKILRIAAAIAVLSGSAIKTKLILEEKHVQYAVAFLVQLYDKFTFGYKDYIEETKKALRKKAENTDFVKVLCIQNPALKILLSSNVFRGIQVQEILGVDREAAAKILSELLQRGLLRITASSAYTPDKLLVNIVKEMEIQC